ncbi:hypothetical protein [Agrobacterium pusense]|jgi:hypothetical protein|uniref:hypothetical protein n=1 Tax=Agrobacterium pusense TaxID=648995 RepID=UPI0037BE8AB6
MNLKRPFILSLALTSSSLMASAEDKPISSGEPSKASAICMPLADFQKYSIDEAGFVANNFSIREVRDNLSAMTRLETTFSVANRSAEAVRLSGDFVFLDGENRILAARNAEPYEPWIASAMTTTGRGKTFVSSGTVATMKTVCLRLFGTFPEAK